ncbi:hypothetical protein ACLKA6_018785 [Drosophila palustris]
MYKFLLRSHFPYVLSGRISTYESLLKLSSKASSTPRPPKDPPDEGYHPESVDHPEIEVSDFVRPQAYRQFEKSEVLGPNAGKSKEYKNAQYFGYHRFSFYELQNQSMELRDERRLSGGIQLSMGEEEEEEILDDSLEVMKEREAEFDKALAAQSKDDEKKKLKDWCLAMEKKQEEVCGKDDEKKLKEWCEEMEKKQQERAKKGQKLENEKEKIRKTIDKRVNEILSECRTAEGGEKKADVKVCEKPKENEKKCEAKNEEAKKCDKPKEKEDKCENKDDKKK